MNNVKSLEPSDALILRQRKGEWQNRGSTTSVITDISDEIKFKKYLALFRSHLHYDLVRSCFFDKVLQVALSRRVLPHFSAG